MSTELHPVSPPPDSRFSISLDEYDGDPFHHFVKDGPVEVWLTVGPAADVGPAGVIDAAQPWRYLVHTLTFPNFPIAHVHVEGLKRALGQLERALERAREAADAPIATRDDGHYHVVRFARYKRALPVVAMCTVCMCELVPDAKQWATDRGLTTSGNIMAEPMNLRNAIEEAVNG